MADSNTATTILTTTTNVNVSYISSNFNTGAPGTVYSLKDPNNTGTTLASATSIYDLSFLDVSSGFTVTSAFYRVFTDSNNDIYVTNKDFYRKLNLSGGFISSGTITEMSAPTTGINGIFSDIDNNKIYFVTQGELIIKIWNPITNTSPIGISFGNTVDRFALDNSKLHCYMSANKNIYRKLTTNNGNSQRIYYNADTGILGTDGQFGGMVFDASNNLYLLGSVTKRIYKINSPFPVPDNYSAAGGFNTTMTIAFNSIDDSTVNDSGVSLIFNKLTNTLYAATSTRIYSINLSDATPTVVLFKTSLASYIQSMTFHESSQVLTAITNQGKLYRFVLPGPKTLKYSFARSSISTNPPYLNLYNNTTLFGITIDLSYVILGSKPIVDSILSTSASKLTINYSQLFLGNPTPTYYYSLNGGSLTSAPASPFDLSGLTSTSPYSFYILARNQAGDISSNLATGYVFLNKPIINTITPGKNQLSVAFSQSIVGTSPTTYYHSTDGTTPLGSGTLTSPLLITGISSQYTFYIIASNNAGSIVSDVSSGTTYIVGSNPVIGTITRGLNQLSVAFSQTNVGTPSPTYYYSTDGTTPLGSGTLSSPLVISGISSSYTFYIIARSAAGDVSSNSTGTGTPYTQGTLPTLSIDSSVNSLILNIGESTGGNPDASVYYYSIDGSFVSIGSYVSKYTIPELTTNASRSIYVGARGYDGTNTLVFDVSSLTQTAIPYVRGTPPNINTVTSGTNKITVAFDGSTGANPTPTYYYSYSSDGSNPIGPVTSPFDISSITTTQTFYIVGTNIAGTVISSVASGTPYIFGSNPTIDTITRGLNQLSVAFSQSIVGTTPTRYYYSTNGTTPLGSGTLTSPLLITGISAQYTFYIIASNSAGNISSNTARTRTPYLVGSTPSLSVDSSTNSLILTYSQSSGGNPSETYYYSIDGSFVSIGSYISPYKISELYTDISRNIYVGARGYDIVNNVIWDISSATIRKSPYVFGSNPTASLVSGVNKLTVTYSQLTAGTSTTTFYYSLNGGGLVAASASPFDISGLTSTSPYSLYVLARNPAGDISSNSVTGNVFGSKPTTSLASGVNKLTVTYLQLTAGTDTTAYYYSLNGGGLVAASASPFDISGLTSTSPYSLYVLARNPAGDISSNSVTGNVFGSNPTASLASGVNKLTVTYSQLTVGTSTTAYYYSLNGGGLVAASASPFDILGLTSTSSYSLYVLARNPAGDISSNSVTGDVFGSKPTASLVSGVNKLTVTYSQLTAGTSATTFYYSLNGGGLVAAPESPFDISGLTTATELSLYVLARNPGGDISSNLVNATPYVLGTKPVISNTIPGTNKITVQFTGSLYGYPEPTYYYSYSADGSNRVGPVVSPFDISNVTTTKTVYIVASNIVGNIISDGSEVIPYVIGSAPIINRILSGVNSLVVDFAGSTGGYPSPSTYLYSLDGGAYINTNTALSPFLISNLTTAKSYAVRLIARNAGGDTNASNSISETPQIITGGSGYGTKVTPATYWRSNYWRRR